MDPKSNGHSELVAEAHGPELDLRALSHQMSGMDLDELIDLARQEGVPLHHISYQRRAAEQRSHVREQALEAARELQPYVTPKRAESIQRVIAVARDLWTALAGSLLGNFAPSVMLIAVCIIEAIRFQQGAALFDPANAWTYAVAAILTFVTILWKIAQEREAGNIPAATKWSLRFALGSMGYRLGLGADAPQKHSFAEAAVLTKGAVQWLIVLVGTFGGLSAKMAELPGKTALGDIEYILGSTGLQDWGTYLGGFVIALALLPALEFAVTMVHDQYRLVAGGMTFRPFDPSSVDTSNLEAAAEAELLRSLILRTLEKRQQAL